VDLSIFEDLGLTAAETKVYVALLEIGSSQAGNIIDATNLQNSVVHRALHALSKHGLISFIYDGKHKTYQATNPEYFYRFIDEKKQRFNEILPELKAKQQLQTEHTKASLYRGVKGITEVYHTLISAQAKEYLTFGGGVLVAQRMSNTWWYNLHKKRVANKLPSRQIFDATVKQMAHEIENNPITDIRYLGADFASVQETVICGNLVAITVFTENAYSFLIEDKAVAEGYKKHFELLWKQAK